MTVKRLPNGKHNERWRDTVAHGRARKRVRRPKRDVLMVKSAMESWGLRYCQEVSFWNPLHTGKQDTWDGGLQWVDFVVMKSGRPFVFIVDDLHKKKTAWEIRANANKLKGLALRGLHVVVLPRGQVSQSYRVLIYMHMKRRNAW